MELLLKLAPSFHFCLPHLGIFFFHRRGIAVGKDRGFASLNSNVFICEVGFVQISGS